MSRRVERDEARNELVIRFAYHAQLVQEVKSLPRRRWDPAAKCWRAPISDAEQVHELLAPLGFEFDASFEGMATASPDTDRATPTLFDAVPPTPTPRCTTPTAPGDDTLSLADLTEQVAAALFRAFPVPIWVVGEVTDLGRATGRRHLFFAFVEKHEGEDRPRARADVALFGDTAAQLLPALESKGLELRDGVSIRAKVRVDFYPAGGRFRLVIEDIDPEYTLGQLALDRERILAELQKKGLERRQIALEMPRAPLRIGVLTSTEAEGWRDFQTQLEQSGIGFAVTLVPVRVQGPDLKRTVVSGLKWFARRADAFDCLCILRGGGSRTDLAWFDDRDVALAVAEHPLKILVGIGHERDRSILDEIAWRDKTPTAVAAFLVDRLLGEIEDLRDRARRLRDAANASVSDTMSKLRDQAHDLRRLLSGRLATERERLGSARHRLTLAPRALLRTLSIQHLGRSTRVAQATSRLLVVHRGNIQRLQERVRSSAEQRLARAADRLTEQSTRLRLLDPRRVLERGFALVRDSEGRVRTDAAGVERGAPIEIQMRDGRLRATAKDVIEEDLIEEGSE